jgi:hypothetical protein
MNAKRLGPGKRAASVEVSSSTKRIAPGITRFDIVARRTHGFMVRMARQGTRHQKFFSDIKYGGKNKALAAAKQQLATWSNALPGRRSTKDRLTSRNRTGTVGVYLSVSTQSANGANEAYCASWTDSNGRRRKINFSTQRYGKKQAWELACLARESQTTDRNQLVTLLKQRSHSPKSERVKRNDSPKNGHQKNFGKQAGGKKLRKAP